MYFLTHLAWNNEKRTYNTELIQTQQSRLVLLNAKEVVDESSVENKLTFHFSNINSSWTAT